MATLPKFIYRSNTILIKILTGKPAGPKNWPADSEIHMEMEGTQNC
jgi:hypothetical protein